MSRFMTFAPRALFGSMLLATFGPPAPAQEREGKEQAALVVDGVVREVFRSPRKGQVDALVQIKVRKAELGQGALASGRMFIPAPGEDIYIHAVELAQDARRAIPAERAQLRAYLAPRPQGGWQGASSDWFELTSNSPAPAAPGDPPPLAEGGPQPGNPPAPRSILEILGIEANPTKVGQGIVLRVAKVAPGGPSAKAGIEPGDVITAANDAPIAGLDQMAEVIRKGGAVATLTVLNVRNGEATPVKVDLGAPIGDAEMAPAPKAPSGRQQPSDEPDRSNSPRDREQPVPGRQLGLSAEEAEVDGVAGLKVTAVKPGSPAQEAGLEVDDFITAANGKGINSPADMTAAVRGSGPVLTLTVRDHRSGRQVDVEVKLGGEDRPAPEREKKPEMPERRGQDQRSPDRSRTSPGPNAGRSLGITTESALVGLVPAAKVTRVERGGPADKAGIEVGDVIVMVNDTVIISPDLIDEAIAKSTGNELTLTVQDVNSGKKTQVKVNLGQ